MAAGRPPDLVINGRFLSQPTTGVQRVAREVTREIDQLLAEAAYPLDVRLICPADAVANDVDYRAIHIERLGGGNGHWWEQVHLPRAVGDATLLCLGNTAPVASLLGRGRVAVMIHDLSYRLYPAAYSRTYRLGHGLLLPLLLRHADPVITVSESERRVLTTITERSSDRIVVAPNGGWPGDSAPLPGPSLAQRSGGYLLYVGSLSQRKNFAGALAVAKRLAQEDRVPSVFVGATPSILRSTMVDLPPEAAQSIRFVGQVESLDELASYYRGARCLLMPSFYESSGLPPVEAMQFGCPVVVSDIPALRERCGDAADYCDPNDIDGMTAAVRRVLFDQDRATQLATLGLDRARQFSWRNQARIILDALLTDATG